MHFGVREKSDRENCLLLDPQNRHIGQEVVNIFKDFLSIFSVFPGWVIYIILLKFADSFVFPF